MEGPHVASSSALEMVTDGVKMSGALEQGGVKTAQMNEGTTFAGEVIEGESMAWISVEQL